MHLGKLTGLFLLATTLNAAVITVTTTSDSGAGSLRQALTDAAAGDSIQFSISSSTITLASDLPEIDKNLSIEGEAQDITIDGASAFRIFSVSDGTVAIENLTLQNGTASGGDGGDGGGDSDGAGGGGGGHGAGGGVFISGDDTDVTLKKLTFIGCDAVGGDGGDSDIAGVLEGGGGGGGLGGAGSSADPGFATDGGGGGGILNTDDASTSTGVGGGGDGTIAGPPSAATPGADFGGGGAGGSPTAAGFGDGAAGGYAGGGGGGGVNTVTADGGPGGFGAGGGGAGSGVVGATGGLGNNAGNGGAGGTTTSGGGGGGSAFGGTIHIRNTAGGASGPIVNIIDCTIDDTGSLTAGGAGSGDNAGTAGNTGGVALYIGDESTAVFNTSSVSTVQEEISGPGKLSQTGTGTLTLSGTNNYTGGTTVSAGILKGDTDSLQGIIVNNATLTFAQSANGTFAGTISGTGDVTVAGPAKLTFDTPQLYTGETIVGDTLILGHATAITSSSAVILDTGPQTANLRTSVSSKVNELSGVGVVTLDANRTLTVDNTSNLTLEGNIIGSGALSKLGLGTWILDGSNTYSGGTTVSDGAIQGDTKSIDCAQLWKRVILRVMR